MKSRRRRERELDALPPKGWRKREVLPRQGEREVDMPPQGSPNEGYRRGGREALRQSRRKLEGPPRVDQTPGEACSLEGYRPWESSPGHSESWRQREKPGIRITICPLKMP